MGNYRFRKWERISKEKTISKLFEGGAKSFCIYPIRMVYTETDQKVPPVSVLITVPKRKIKKAVDRNKIKRQIKEAYRTQKNDLIEVVTKRNRQLIIGFIYVSDELYSSQQINECMNSLLLYIVEKQQS